jgi:50S ribosomal protein L16 3-hydroxylase
VKSEEPSVLSMLLPSFTPEHFLSEYWSQRHVHATGPLERLLRPDQIVAYADVDVLLKRCRGPVTVPLPDKHDEHSSIKVDPSSARSLYANGFGMILGGMHQCLPPVAGWLAGLAHELGLPRRSHARSIAYASPKGCSTVAHYDGNANFVIQLKGRKRWRVAKNELLPFPTERWAINMPRLPEGLRLGTAWPTEESLFSGGQEIELVEGSVLFLPRGYWHSTESVEESLAVNLTYTEPTWADVVIAFLRRRMKGEARWRQAAEGLEASEVWRRAGGLATLDGLLGVLREDLAHITAEAVDQASRAEGDQSFSARSLSTSRQHS